MILLFLPLVESEIRDNLTAVEEINTAHASTQTPSRLFLLDEPELHLHPDLQRRMLAYMRERSSTKANQFILITHSPTILDEAADDELYVLAPARGNNNQLQKAASPTERLDALRELTGESYFLSTGRNIVCVEGEAGPVKGKLSDHSLIELLSNRSGRYTFVPMGGRSQVLAAVGRLRDSLPVDRYGVSVVGLVDSDRAGADPEGCVSWPFCEIENALIQTDLINAALTALKVPAVEPAALDAIIANAGESLKDDEIRLRVTRQLSSITIRPIGTTIDEIRHAYESSIAEMNTFLESDTLQIALDAANDEVNKFLADGSYIRKFRGKRLLRKIYAGLDLRNISYERFCYALAVAGRSHPATMSEINAVFDALDAAARKQTEILLAALPEEPESPAEAA